MIPPYKPPVKLLVISLSLSVAVTLATHFNWSFSITPFDALPFIIPLNVAIFKAERYIWIHYPDLARSRSKERRRRYSIFRLEDLKSEDENLRKIMRFNVLGVVGFLLFGLFSLILSFYADYALFLRR